MFFSKDKKLQLSDVINLLSSLAGALQILSCLMAKNGENNKIKSNDIDFELFKKIEKSKNFLFSEFPELAKFEQSVSLETCIRLLSHFKKMSDFSEKNVALLGSAFIIVSGVICYKFYDWCEKNYLEQSSPNQSFSMWAKPSDSNTNPLFENGNRRMLLLP